MSLNRFQIIPCVHKWIDMTRDREFMEQFIRGALSQTVGKDIPEVWNPATRPSLQKARKLMAGAHLHVCKKCGVFFIGEKEIDSHFMDAHDGEQVKVRRTETGIKPFERMFEPEKIRRTRK